MSLRSRIKNYVETPIFSIWQLALYCSAVATIVGRDGLKSGAVILMSFIILSIGGIVLGMILEKGRK